MVMGDALRALIDAVGLEVGPGEEIRSDDDRWTLDLDPDGTHAWVATRHRPVWLHRDDTLVFIEAGGAALVEQHPTTSIGSDQSAAGARLRASVTRSAGRRGRTAVRRRPTSRQPSLR